MTDPFALFMEIYVPSCGLEEAFRSWLLKQEQQESPYVMPDIEPFLDTSGKYIGGRRAWREHLAITNAQEFGRNDLQHLTERHEREKQNYRRRMAEATSQAPPHGLSEQARPIEPSRTASRVLERLHGRPAPDRPTLIKIALEERFRK